MFFSPDLLLKRDSGFGLLWLAATLGSKSAFKKLPKRSVMTADISQLCELIATPAEPLALRLSSNLLVGAARCQEILMSDVTTCFNSLKRMVQEFRSMTALEGELQMAQPSVKPAAVTLRADPNAVFSLNFDNMVSCWDEYLNLGGKNHAENDSDDDYNPKVKKVKGKGKSSAMALPSTEAVRANAHTLHENHEFLLANSFDASFGGSGANLSSSQNVCFGFDDTFDGLDIGEGIGEDLVRELGEGWGASPFEDKAAGNAALTEDLIDFDFNGGGDLNYEMPGVDGIAEDISQPVTPIQSLHFELGVGPPPLSSLAGTAQSHNSASMNPMSPQAEPAAQQANGQQVVGGDNANPPRRVKRARLLLDARTELTDEELKAARIHYLDEQNAIRRELELKRFEREHPGLIHNLLWDPPGSVQAKELVDFWVDHFKAHVEARSSLFMEPQDELPRSKRRKMRTDTPNPHAKEIDEVSRTYAANDWHGHEAAGALAHGDGMEIDFNYNSDGIWGGAGVYTPDARNFRSSEEPGQARRASRPPSALGDNFDIGVVADANISQRSALFPWDMAGNSSLVDHGGGIRLGSSDRMSVEPADTRLRGSSLSRRVSSLPSAPGSLQPGMGSPAAVPRGSQIVDEFAFDVPGNDSLLESQQSEANLAALEKDSFNFLEYAKMQYMSLSGTSQHLVFDDVVPKATSTAHVGAAALYHCLVLGTKDLLRLNQEEPYGRIHIRIK
ncbi:hypothetical protein PAXRUDRAFT_36561 [Paxillus rubicundulus Ve08.2h10]|uniref:Rad21/Rec8-like protein N-terminal domain-containing protein n=1 Tax=Paxillus rubicundulus Ve08.2h10 TaxID=930991 RepID=A0A0D0D582_9AGAM|nr:hypothetical protein PAXRUDRAFT_36561 [Paxillus rubicundulus Ve08.2h10]